MVQFRGKIKQIKKEAENILKKQRPYNRTSARLERKNKSDTGNNRSKWNHFKITWTTYNIPGKHEVKELQKTAISGTAYILREGLMEKYQHFTGEVTLYVAQIINT